MVGEHMTAFLNTGMPHAGLVENSLSSPSSSDAGFRKTAIAQSASKRVVRSTARSAVKWSSRGWGFVDALIAAGSFSIAHFLSPWRHAVASSPYLVPLVAAVYAGSLLFFSYILGAYDRHNFTSRGRMVAQSLAVNVLALALVTLALGWLGYVQIGRY